MASRPSSPDGEPPEPTEDELEQRKRVADRRVLLDHVDSIVRPPAWVYAEIEAAIEDQPQRTIESRDGRMYRAFSLVEGWELEFGNPRGESIRTHADQVHLRPSH